MLGWINHDEAWDLGEPSGYDADNNYLSDDPQVEEGVSWSVTGSLDGVAGSGTSIEFTPSTSSTSGTIVVSSAGATSDETGTITVINPPIIFITRIYFQKLIMTKKE